MARGNRRRKIGASTREETRREECEKEACREEGDEEEGEVTDEAAKPEITTYSGSLRSQELKRIAFAACWIFALSRSCEECYSSLGSTRSWRGGTTGGAPISLSAPRAVPAKSAPASNIVTGSVSAQASAMLRIVRICKPDIFAAIVPATPEERACVVLTGNPKMSAAAMVVIATSSADAPCA